MGGGEGREGVLKRNEKLAGRSGNQGFEIERGDLRTHAHALRGRGIERMPCVHAPDDSIYYNPSYKLFKKI